MAGILRNFQRALKNVFLKIKKTCITLTKVNNFDIKQKMAHNICFITCKQ